MAWFRLLQLLPGVGPARARRAIDGLRDDDGALPLSYGEVLRRWPSAADALPADARDLSRDLAEAMASSECESVALHAERIRRAVAPLIAGSYDDAAPRLEDLGALVLASAGAARLSDVASDHVLDAPASTGDLAGPPLVDEDWLTLSTVHSAKGLEFDAVHVIHAADGNFPADMSLGTAAGLEEERRLFYVAITRARRHLSIYVPLRYHHHRIRDDHSWAQPSRFLSDAVRATLAEVSTVPHGESTTEPAPPVAVDGAGVVAEQLSRLW
jgi:DNA helicase-2/ATP-dependent DNA helicase PcrA